MSIALVAEVVPSVLVLPWLFALGTDEIEADPARKLSADMFAPEEAGVADIGSPPIVNSVRSTSKGGVEVDGSKAEAASSLEAEYWEYDDSPVL